MSPRIEGLADMPPLNHIKFSFLFKDSLEVQSHGSLRVDK